MSKLSLQDIVFPDFMTGTSRYKMQEFRSLEHEELLVLITFLINIFEDVQHCAVWYTCLTYIEDGSRTSLRIVARHAYAYLSSTLHGSHTPAVTAVVTSDLTKLFEISAIQFWSARRCGFSCEVRVQIHRGSTSLLHPSTPAIYCCFLSRTISPSILIISRQS